MNTRTTALIIAISLITLFCCGIAHAGALKSPVREQPLRYDLPVASTRAHALLTGSPYLAEIARVRERQAEREQRLLARLRSTTDKDEFQRIVSCLERLETDTQLEIYQVQAHYARLAGMLDLEREIRSRILEIKELETAQMASR